MNIRLYVTVLGEGGQIGCLRSPGDLEMVKTIKLPKRQLPRIGERVPLGRITTTYDSFATLHVQDIWWDMEPIVLDLGWLIDDKHFGNPVGRLIQLGFSKASRSLRFADEPFEKFRPAKRLEEART